MTNNFYDNVETCPLSLMDGYRSAIMYSELFNKNDQQEFLLVKTKPIEDGNLFGIFAASDFFSDRTIKSFSEIYLDIFK